MVCAVVGGVQRAATSASVMPFCRRMSRIRLIMVAPPKDNQIGFFSFLQIGPLGKRAPNGSKAKDSKGIGDATAPGGT